MPFGGGGADSKSVSLQGFFTAALLAFWAGQSFVVVACSVCCVLYVSQYPWLLPPSFNNHKCLQTLKCPLRWGMRDKTAPCWGSLYYSEICNYALEYHTEKWYSFTPLLPLVVNEAGIRFYLPDCWFKLVLSLFGSSSHLISFL